MNTESTVIMAAAGTAAAVMWMILYVTNRGKYADVTGTKAAGELKLSELFFIGFAVMKILHINVRSERFSARRRNISAVYGTEYTEYYAYLFMGAQITYAFTLFPVSLLFGAITGSTAFALMGTAASVLMLFYLDAEIKKKATEKDDELLCELPDMVIRLALLLNAGMVLREAWSLTAQSSDSVLCREMRKTSEDIRNGVSESEAFEKFADRCRNRETRKFVSVLLQNIKKGSAGLAETLQYAAAEQWDEKKNYVRKKAASAEQKLLLPMLMIFVAVIVMIIVPVFTNMF